MPKRCGASLMSHKLCALYSGSWIWYMFQCATWRRRSGQILKQRNLLDPGTNEAVDQEDSNYALREFTLSCHVNVRTESYAQSTSDAFMSMCTISCVCMLLQSHHLCMRRSFPTICLRRNGRERVGEQMLFMKCSTC